MHDHGHEAARMLDVVNCPKCRQPMQHETGMYQVTTPDERFPGRRVAVRLGAA